MASKAKMGPQDMPPKGGYGPIQIERIKLRSIISGKCHFSFNVNFFFFIEYFNIFTYYFFITFSTKNCIVFIF